MLRTRIYFLNPDPEIKRAYDKDEIQEIKEERQLKFKINIQEVDHYQDNDYFITHNTKSGTLVVYAKINCKREDQYVAHIFIDNELIERFDVVISLTDAVYGIGFYVPDYEYYFISFC